MDADAFRRGALELLSTGAIVDPDDAGVERVLPALVLDPSGRPDVADLVRVQADEGVGDLRCGVGVWDLGPPEAWLVRLEVAVDHPVRCRFHTVLGWADHREWLAAVGAAGSVALALGDPDGRWLVLTVDPDRLLPLLALPGDAPRWRPDGSADDPPGDPSGGGAPS